MGKKHIIAILALALCTVLCIVGVSALNGRNAVQIKGERFHVSFSLPDGWEYRVDTDDYLGLDICLWPEGHSEEPMWLTCSAEAQSLYPTCVPRNMDLELTQSEFHGQDWRTIELNGVEYAYVTNGGLGGWWDEYRTETTEMIQTMRVKRIPMKELSEKEIIARAVELTAEMMDHPQPDAEAVFDKESHTWEVLVNGADGDSVAVTLGEYGDLKSRYYRTAPDGFSFALTWGCYGISSYDSDTGKLVKTNDATHPEDYVTEYRMTAEELAWIWDLIRDLDVESYPDEYDPQNGRSKPSMTLILTVRTADGEKTIAAKGIGLDYESEDAKGQRFLSFCRDMEELLTATDAWKALPEYEKLYE